MTEEKFVPLNTIRENHSFEVCGKIYNMKNRFYDTVFAEREGETYRFSALQIVKYIEPFRDGEE